MALGTGTLLAAALVNQGFNQINTASREAGAIEDQGAFQSSLYRYNAKVADMQAEDAIRRGDREAELVRREGKQIVGTQRAIQAAQGLDISQGTPLEIQEHTESFSAIDAITIRNNARKEAFGYKARSIESSLQGKFTKFASKSRAGSTLLSGGLQAANTFLKSGIALTR